MAMPVVKDAVPFIVAVSAGGGVGGVGFVERLFLQDMALISTAKKIKQLYFMVPSIKNNTIVVKFIT